MSIWTDKKHEAWAELAKKAEIFVEKVSEREDVAVLVEPDMRSTEEIELAPIPAGVFYPNFARMNINASLIFDKNAITDITYVDPNGFVSQNLYPKLIGTLVHESAHAKHSKWLFPKGIDGRVLTWVKALEETRAERQIVEDFPQYAKYIKTILQEIVYDDFKSTNHEKIYDRYSAANIALLVCARETIDVISVEEIKPIVEKCSNILGATDYDELSYLWVEGQAIDDEDIDGLISVAERIQKLVDPEDEAQDFDFSDRTPCGAFSTSESEEANADDPSLDKPEDSEETSQSGSDFSQEIQDIQDASLNENESQKDKPKKTQREIDKERKQDIKKAKESIKQPQKPSSGYSYRSYYSPTKTMSTPNSKDISRMRAIMNALKQAQYREVTKTITPSELPPGRLHIREAMNRSAQIASKQQVTAMPWRQTKRREVENPPITLAVATDISGSMDSWQREVSSFTWAVASAVKNLQGKVGAVAWDTDSYDLIDPNRFSKDIATYNCVGGSSGCPKAMKALDGLMNLGYGEGVRILTVITDGLLGGSNTEIQKEVNLLTQKGVIVVWLLTTARGFAPKNSISVHLKNPNEFGKVVGKIMVEALARA